MKPLASPVAEHRLAGLVQVAGCLTLGAAARRWCSSREALVLVLVVLPVLRTRPELVADDEHDGQRGHAGPGRDRAASRRLQYQNLRSTTRNSSHRVMRPHYPGDGARCSISRKMA
jgi:hypothetical protein